MTVNILAGSKRAVLAVARFADRRPPARRPNPRRLRMMTPSSTPVWIYRVLIGGEVRDLVCVLPTEIGFATGLPEEAIVGMLLEPAANFEGPGDAAPELSPENFAENPVFRTFFHDMVRRYAPDEPELREQARGGQRFVYVIDPRTPDPGLDLTEMVEDIVGTFEVCGGAVVSEAYVPNPHYRLFTENGFFTLSGAIGQRLLEEVERRAVMRKAAS
jgi:hypothetical protein